MNFACLNHGRGMLCHSSDNAALTRACSFLTTSTTPSPTWHHMTSRIKMISSQYLTMHFPPCSNFYEVTVQTHLNFIDVLGHQDVWQEWNRENWDVMEWIGWWPKDPGRFNHVATTSTLTWWCDFEKSHRKFPDSATLPWNIQNYVAFWCILEVNLWVSCRWLCSYTSSLKSLHLSRSSCFQGCIPWFGVHNAMHDDRWTMTTSVP